MDYVVGFTIGHDVTARDLIELNDGQFLLAKCFDTSLPLGPVLVTKDDISGTPFCILDLMHFFSDSLEVDKNNSFQYDHQSKKHLNRDKKVLSVVWLASDYVIFKVRKQPFIDVLQKAVQENFAIFTGKHMCWSFFQACNFIKKRFQHRCFSANIAKYLRKTFFTEHLRWLLLKVWYNILIMKP